MYVFYHGRNIKSSYLKDTILVFSDENDAVYQDDDYKNAHHKEYYLKEISEDIHYYGKHSFKIIKNKFSMDGKKPAFVVECLIEEYHLL